MNKTARITIYVLAVLLCMVVYSPASLCEAEMPYVADAAGLLTSEQRSKLEERAEAISMLYQCDVRIVTVQDMADYGFDNMEEFSYSLYENNDLGFGTGKECALLLLSMDERDYNIDVWGDNARIAISAYAIDSAIENHILPLLKNDNYYDAFSVYLDKAEQYLRMAADGNYFSRGNDPVYRQKAYATRMAVIVVVPLLAALVVCMIWRSQMKTARIAKKADNYIPEGGFRLSARGDVFLYKTVRRERIERPTSSSSSSGGASSRSGGSVGRSGKF